MLLAAFLSCNLNQGGLDTKFELLKINARLKNVVGCIPFLAMETKSRNQKDI